MPKFLYNNFMAVPILRVPSLTYDRVHEYRVGPRGTIEHRLTLQEGGKRSDGTSEWTVASKDYIRAAVCHAQSYVTEWFRARGITCESVAAMIEREKRTKKPSRAKAAPHLVLR
jgi:hypothetical protein